MQVTDCFYLGTITKMHGLKGHVVLKLDTDEPSEYYNMESVFILINGQLIPFIIEEIDVLKTDTLRILCKDIEGSRIVGCNVYLPLDLLPKLEGNKFYFHEVINFEIRENNKKVGVILGVNDRAAQPYFITADEDGSEQLIPIVDSWILEVNREGKFIEMNLPEGLIS